ncbi:unnamed protein product [Darwinula stevensoni]|uniref:Uncharacterized protein n=1 Tax=Darwinula stevensoni TaxID=69355 RepID=A0A7R9FQV6_9CRUS|nr:unnamed protein product [Darwinula stevensoni]CAG0900456.1 unnamed protein product [Darwinula stevensoni]
MTNPERPAELKNEDLQQLIYEDPSQFSCQLVASELLSKRTIIRHLYDLDMSPAATSESNLSSSPGYAGVGMAAVTPKTYARTLLDMYHPVQTMVDKMCSRTIYEMLKKDPGEVGCISRAITTSDGAWLTRGSHSKNSSFIIRDFLTGGYLSAEGYAASEGFRYLKTRGVHVEVNWQDKDSTSKLSFREAYPDEALSKIMICGGHAARSHTNVLQKYAGQKTVTKAFADNHKSLFPKLVLEAQKSESKKKYRVRMKKARLEENDERKRWMKTQAFTHDYGSAEDESEEEVEIEELGEEIGACNEAILFTSNLLVTATKEV